jgi:hypothetical protein
MGFKLYQPVPPRLAIPSALIYLEGANGVPKSSTSVMLSILTVGVLTPLPVALAVD